MELLTTTTLVVAVVAAVRGTWSPCGVSMLSSITPLTESGRGHRYGSTISWFLFGSVLGGATLGALAALGALLVSTLDLRVAAVSVAAVVGAAVTLASDLGVGGFRLPANPRQVNRSWLDRYRAWVYGIGFGWQLGVGVATFVMSATVYLMVLLAALTGRPLFALVVVTLFGVIRGLAILPAAAVKTPADLMRLHRNIERFRPASRALAVATQVAVVAVALGFVAGPVAGAVAGVGLGALAWRMRGQLKDPAPKVRRTSPTAEPAR